MDPLSGPAGSPATPTDRAESAATATATARGWGPAARDRLICHAALSGGRAAPPEYPIGTIMQWAICG